MMNTNRLKLLMFVLYLTVLYEAYQASAKYCPELRHHTRYRPSYQLQYKTVSRKCGIHIFGYEILKFWTCEDMQSYRASTSISYDEPYYNRTLCCPGYGGTYCEAQCYPSCQNGGKCSSPNVCTCTPEWKGYSCAEDVDECDVDNGECEHVCTNTDGSYYCSCYHGYQPLQNDTFNCTDVDECLIDNGGCTHQCNNAIGSYNCSCWNGYELSSDNHTCIDIKECEIGTHNCSQLCIELPGGFKCSCYLGYQLQADDNITCEDINECAEHNGGCQHNCTNANGSYSCSCRAGYKLTDDGHNCTEYSLCDKLHCPLITKVILFMFLIAVGIIGGIVFVRVYKKARKEKSSQYALGEKGYENIPMATKDSDEDGEGGDSSDSTTTDEHKKMLN